DLTISSEEEEYTESSDEEEEYDECKVSQLHFLSGKKWKVGFEEVLNVSTEPPPPLPKYYGPRDFRQLTQPDGKGHLSTSVATTSARVGFKCRSILAKLREIYLRLINAQLEHRAAPYDPPEKLHCFPTDNLVTSLREVGWIEAQHYIVGHHADYDAYWRHVSHGALMSDIARGLKSNGKMTKVKRELLKRGLHMGGVRGEGHLKVGPLFPDDQDATLDVFIDSSSEEEDRSSTDYSDDEVIDEIKMEILILEDEIEEL
ncbi:hypothetical protein GIB67_019489, partial [Kingdonia uniflora]